MKKTLIILLLIATFSLSSCKMRENIDEANTLVHNFCSSLETNDISKARSYLHPDSNLNDKDFITSLREIENKYDIDFSDGITIKRRTSFEITAYHSEYDGSVYEITYRVVVSEKRLDFNFMFVKNTIGYGIYTFEVL